MPKRFHRRSIRLKAYDYAQAGAYFVTICTYDRAHLFGQVVEGVMMPNALGDMVQRCWDAIPEHMPRADIDAFVVMPNHVHGIVVIGERALDAGRPGAMDGRGVGVRHDAPLPNAPPTDPHTKPPGIPRGALGQIVASFKTAVSRGAYRDGLLPRGIPIWQRNYYEHIIRTTADHDRIAQYIAENPANWGSDDLRLFAS